MKSIIQWCFSAGAIWPLLQGRNQTIRINDRFFLGGPLNVRGFDYHGAGPHSEGSTRRFTVNAMKNTSFFQVRLSAVIVIGHRVFICTRPFPFYTTAKISCPTFVFITFSTVEMYSIHSPFVSSLSLYHSSMPSTGYLCSGSTQTFLSQLTNATRLSCGLGLVLNLMNVARLELNYTVPLWTQAHDR